jgi:enediyne biosynthesis protein E4
MLRAGPFCRPELRLASCLLLMLLPTPRPAAAQQGMASPTRPKRSVRQIETSLPPITVDFRDLAEQAGLVAPNVSGAAERKRYILEAAGGGVALFDHDGDGQLDVFVTSGTTFDAAQGGEAPTSRFYRNLGGLRFADVTREAGLSRVGWAQGACVGDYDNDGRRDLFVTYYGQSALYHNEREGRFRDVTQAAGLETRARWDSGCTFLDYDLDGKLDLFVSSYLEFEKERVPEPGSGNSCLWKGLSVMCGPRGLPFSRNRLLRNLGGGRFEDVSEASGIASSKSCYGFTVVASDFDDDGYPDLYVACDSTPSLLYRNLANGRFEELGLLSGAALNESGQEQGGMGVAVADYDEDGHVDIVKTNFSDDVPNVYWGRGNASFEDRVFESGLGAYMSYVGWGVHLMDLDHDGLRDLLLVNGHVYPEADRIPDVSYRQPRLLYWNVGGGKFKDVSDRSGPGIQERWSSRGSAAGDLDGDGTLEVVINNLGARPSLLKNVAPQKNWLLVRCVGVKSNRDAIGARVYLYVGERRLSGEVQGGASFVSQDDSRQHFGLGAHTRYARIEVAWPGGQRESFPGGEANRVVVVEQGRGSPVARR